METKSPDIRFGPYEVDLQAGELRKDGARLKLTGQPFQVLAILLEHPGKVITREELQQRLWPDTFVDFDHNLNSAINRIREVLHDSAESPQFVETLPRRGYRFIAPAEVTANGQPATESRSDAKPQRNKLVPVALAACVLLLATAGWLAYKKWHPNTPAQPVQRALTRLTSDEGLQTGATWSPDGRFIAYSSDRGGKYDIWVQQISGGDPVQVTKGPGENWMPDWSPDGKYIAYRSEEGEGGIYITPALGGAGMQRKIASFGYYPHWSPDSSRILFQPGYGLIAKNVYVVGLDGSPPREVLTAHPQSIITMFAAWHPDGKRITTWTFDDTKNIVDPESPAPNFLTAPLDGGPAFETRFPPELQKQIEAVAAADGIVEWRLDFRFAWAPSGKAIYFERTFRGARNVWRMTVDPVTLQATNVERLTTSPGLDSELSLSPNGSKLAFTSERQQIRAWALPFDANHGHVTGPGQPVTSAGIEAWALNLSRDGKRLIASGNHDGQEGIWEASLPNGREEPFVAGDSYSRSVPVWSPDGQHAAYARWPEESGIPQIVIWSSDHRTEDPIQAMNFYFVNVFDWSPDGVGPRVALE